MLSCRHAADLLSRELDGPLAPRERVRLRWHLLMCRLCRAYGGQLRLLRRVCARAAAAEAPAEALGPTARARIRATLERAV